MFATMILAAALCGQAKTDAVSSPERQRAMLAAIRAKTADPRVKAEAAAEIRRRRAVSAENLARYKAGEIRSTRARWQASNREVAREVAAIQAQQAAIMAEQARQYRADLPYMLELRRQDLARQSELERNQILNRALNGTSYVPATNLTPQPVDNGNRMPTP